MESATATAIGSLSSTPCSELKPVVCKKEVEFSPSKTPEKKPTKSPFTSGSLGALVRTKLNERKASKHGGNSIDTNKEIHAHGSGVAEGDHLDVSKDPPAPSSLGHGGPTSSPPPPPPLKDARDGPSETVPHCDDGNGLGFEKTKMANVDHFGNLNNQSLNQSFDSAISRVTTLSEILRQGVGSLEQELTRLVAVEKKSNGEIARLQQELELVTKDRDRWMERFTNEVSTGREFHQSEAGQRFLEEIKKEHLDMFKRSVSFKRLVVDEATDIFDQTVQECQKKLKKTGRFPHNGSF